MGDRKSGASSAHRMPSQEEQIEQARVLYDLRVQVGDELRRRKMGQPCSVAELAQAADLAGATLHNWGAGATREEIDAGTARASRRARPDTLASLTRRVLAFLSAEPSR